MGQGKFVLQPFPNPVSGIKRFQITSWSLNLSCTVILYCTVLSSCVVLHCHTPFFTFLPCYVLSSVLRCLALSCRHFALSYSFLHFPALLCAVLHCLELFCRVLHCSSLFFGTEMPCGSGSGYAKAKSSGSGSTTLIIAYQ